MACCSAAIEVSTKLVKKKVCMGKRRENRNGHTVDNRTVISFIQTLMSLNPKQTLLVKL